MRGFAARGLELAVADTAADACLAAQKSSKTLQMHADAGSGTHEMGETDQKRRLMGSFDAKNHVSERQNSP